MKLGFSLWLFVFGLGLVACGHQNGLEVREVWGRVSPAAADNGAFYMVLDNRGDKDDRLVRVETDACRFVELHEMVMGEGNVMSMNPVAGGSIPIPAGETVRLEAGGLHVMCLGKQVAFDAGVEVPLTLVFEGAGEVRVNAQIRETAP